MLKEKIVLEFENMKEAIKALEDEHKKHSSSYEKELIKETLENIIKKNRTIIRCKSELNRK